MEDGPDETELELKIRVEERKRVPLRVRSVITSAGITRRNAALKLTSMSKSFAWCQREKLIVLSEGSILPAKTASSHAFIDFWEGVFERLCTKPN